MAMAPSIFGPPTSISSGFNEKFVYYFYYAKSKDRMHPSLNIREAYMRQWNWKTTSVRGKVVYRFIKDNSTKFEKDTRIDNPLGFTMIFKVKREVWNKIDILLKQDLRSSKLRTLLRKYGAGEISINTVFESVPEYIIAGKLGK